MDNCIFCMINNRELPSRVVYEDEFVLAFEDIKPQAPVHVVVICKKHVDNIVELADEDDKLIGAMIRACVKVAEIKGIKEDGFRIINNCGEGAGQTIMHIHMHVLGGSKFGETIV